MLTSSTTVSGSPPSGKRSTRSWPTCSNVSTARRGSSSTVATATWLAAGHQMLCMRTGLATYDAGDEFDHSAAEGFVKIWGLPVETAAPPVASIREVPVWKRRSPRPRRTARARADGELMSEKQPLWSGRFAEAPDAGVFQFQASFSFDRRLFEDDVTGSLAWADALAAAGVLSSDDAAAIEKGLTDHSRAWASRAGVPGGGRRGHSLVCRAAADRDGRW